MLNQTTLTAVRALIHLVVTSRDTPATAAELAAALGESPTYVAKVTTQLAKAGVLSARKGARGGLVLARNPATITLREIYEACQGRPPSAACTDGAQLRLVCSFHRAMVEIENAVREPMERWTLADLSAKPTPSPSIRDVVPCRLEGVVPRR